MSNSFSIDFGENVTAGLADLARRGVDMSPAMGEISRYLVSRIEIRFQTETAPDRTPWKPSQRVEGYTDRAGKHHPGDGGQTLTLNGYLRRSMREEWGTDFASAGPQASGPAAIYARLMQEGGTIRPTSAGALNTPFGPRASVKIPAREYLGFSDRIDGPEVIEILGDFIMAELGDGA